MLTIAQIAAGESGWQPPTNPPPLLTIVLKLDNVPSLNKTNREKIGGGIRRGGAGAEALRYAAKLGALTQHGYRDMPNLAGRLRLEIHLYYPDNRHRDILNADVKPALDGFTDAGVWVDDCQLDEASFHRHLDRATPRVEFRIFKIEKE